jgi:hypothetical protein
MGARLALGPEVTGQVEGEPLNQIIAVKACMQHHCESLAKMLEEKIQITVAAASTMSQLEGPMDELEKVLLNSHQ